MASVSKLHLFDFILNSLIDIVLLIATEFLTRCIFSTNFTGAQDSYTKQINLLTIQATILMLSGSVLYVFHHTPYLLAFITAFILLRLLMMAVNRSNGEGVYPDGFVSQPIRHGSDWPIRNDGITQPGSDYRHPGRSNVVQSHGQFRYSAVPVTGSQGQGFRQRPVSRESIPNQVPQQRPVITPRTHATDTLRSDSERISLQRSPLLSSTPAQLPQADTQASASTQSGSSYGTQSLLRWNLGYFSSIFKRRERNTTPSGMYNLGNTCFINSTLQCLIWTKGFIESLPYMYSLQVYSDNTRLVRVLDDVVNLCHGFADSGGDSTPVSVTELLRSISLVAPHLVAMPGGDAYQSQQDAAEFLLWLLNHVHGILRVQSGGKSGLDLILSDTNISDLAKNKQACLSILQKSKSTDISSLREPLTNLSDVDWQLHWQEDSSTLYQLFLGQLIEARECQMCGKMSFSIEYFTVLPLPSPMSMDVDRHCTLADCLKLFSRTEDMTQSNMITCSCISGSGETLTPGKRLTLLSRPSRRLVIQLTRYSYDSAQSSAVKNVVSVLFPLVIDLFPHTMSSILGNNNQVNSMVYELQGFCVHSGALSTSYGHYVAYCKASTERWYYFNDDQVSIIDNIEAELTSNFVLQNAYLLFYSLQDR